MLQQHEPNYCEPLTVPYPHDRLHLPSGKIRFFLRGGGSVHRLHERYTTPPVGSAFSTLFEYQCGFFYVPFQLLRVDEEDKANGLVSPLNDAII